MPLKTRMKIIVILNFFKSDIQANLILLYCFSIATAIQLENHALFCKVNCWQRCEPRAYSAKFKVKKKPTKYARKSNLDVK